MSEAICLGIDFGTTNTRIACHFKGNPPINSMIIENEESEIFTPSFVSFDDNQVFIGKKALEKRSENPTNTFYNIKQIIGKKITEEFIEDHEKKNTYLIREGGNGTFMYFTIDTKRYKDQNILPEQIAAMIFSYLKKCVDKKCTKNTSKVVLTVPNNFSHKHRRIIMDIARIAGLDPIGVLNESTAACVAYAYNSRYKPGTKHVLVYDIGGGFIDVSLVRIEGGEIRVIATAGNSNFCGSDIDNELLKICKKKIFEEFNIDLDNYDLDYHDIERNRCIKAQLLLLCEEAKIKLSSQENTEIIFPNILPNKTFKITFTKSDIERIILTNKEILFQPIDQVLNQSKIKTTDIDDILLLGGCIKIPIVKTLIEEKLNQTTFTPSYADESVSVGSSIYGLFKLGIKIKDFPTFKITEVTPMAIGFGTRSGQLQIAIPRNSPIPAHSEPRAFKTSDPETKRVQLTVYEGDSENQRECYKIATFEIELPHQLQNYERIFERVDVTDTEITLYAIVSNTPPAPGGDPNEKKLTIKNDKPAHTPEDINRMKQDNLKMLEAQQEESDINYLAIAIQNCNAVKTGKAQMTKDKKIKAEIDKIVKDFKNELNEEFNDSNRMTLEQFNEKMNEFEDRIVGVCPSYTRPSKFQSF